LSLLWRPVNESGAAILPPLGAGESDGEGEGEGQAVRGKLSPNSLRGVSVEGEAYEWPDEADSRSNTANLEMTPLARRSCADSPRASVETNGTAVLVPIDDDCLVGVAPPSNQRELRCGARSSRDPAGGGGVDGGGSGGSDGSDGTLSRSDTPSSGFSSTAGETSVAAERSERASPASGEAGGGGGEASELLSAAGAAGSESSEGGGSCVQLLGAEASPARREGGAAGVAAPVARRPLRERVAALECRI